MYTSIYIKSFHTTGVYLGCRGFNVLRFIHCTLEMKIEIILGSCNFPSISIMKLPSWFGLCVPILIIISEN